jgi:plasmid stability protein
VRQVPTKNPRVNVVLEAPLYESLRRWAKRDGVSLSLKVRDLITAALQEEEDRVLVRFAEGREKSFDRRKALTHAQVWSHLKRQRR